MIENKEQIDAITASLRRKGVTFQVVEYPVDKDDPSKTTAAVVISQVPKLEQEVMSFFVLKKPCWFEGCEELREMYKKDMERLPSDCKDCAKGRIINKYEDKVREYLTGKQHEQESTNSGPIAIPGPSISGGARTGWFKAVLRRAATCAKTVFKTGSGTTS